MHQQDPLSGSLFRLLALVHSATLHDFAGSYLGLKLQIGYPTAIYT
jgi:hypothetical protein